MLAMFTMNCYRHAAGKFDVLCVPDHKQTTAKYKAGRTASLEAVHETRGNISTWLL